MIGPFLTNIALGTLVVTSGMAMAMTVQSQTSSQKPAVTKPLSSPSLRVAQSDPSTNSLEQAVYDQINHYRTNQGLPPLTLDARISDQARTHSQDMASGAVPFGHDGLRERIQAIARVIPYRAAAENVAYNQGYADPATQAVQGWLQSPGHRQNIEGHYDLTGIGVANNARGEYYFTQIFIRSR